MILFLDVDGTLVDYQTNLPASAADAVRGAIANGHRVYLCTGRSKAEIYPYLWDLGVHGLIGGNGSYVESDGEVVHHQVLSPDAVARSVDWLLSRGVAFYVECNSGLFGTEDLPDAIAALLPGGATAQNVAWVRGAFPHMVHGNLSDPDAAWRGDVNKISFVLRPDLDLAALAGDLGDGVQVDTWLLSADGPAFGEIGQVGVHKGVAVRILAEHLGVGKTELIGFGDARSDLELLRACGTGVAMGQAPDEVKAAATHVTDPVDADGLAAAFRRFELI